MKVISSDIVHKSDIGGVKINILNNEKISKAYQDIIKQVNKIGLKQKIVGCFFISKYQREQKLW